MALDDNKGVWKKGRGKGRATPKGRQFDDDALQAVRDLLGDRPRKRDLLIELLHLIQDTYGHLSASHLRALAEEMRLSMAEIWEVATFYAHFDPLRETDTAPPNLTIRVCDSLSCELAGSEALIQALENGAFGRGDFHFLRAAVAYFSALFFPLLDLCGLGALAAAIGRGFEGVRAGLVGGQVQREGWRGSPCGRCWR